MLKPIQNILFATNLTENCMQAFDFAAVLATRFQAKIILLHVMEQIPDYVEGRLRGLLGDEQWEKTMQTSRSSARERLIGKRSNSSIVQNALNAFCANVGIDEASCGYQSREIVVSSGDVVEDIISTSKDFDCDVIILGTRSGLVSKNSVGSTTRNILKKSAIPVVIVPADENAKE